MLSNSLNSLNSNNSMNSLNSLKVAGGLIKSASKKDPKKEKEKKKMIDNLKKDFNKASNKRNKLGKDFVDSKITYEEYSRKLDEVLNEYIPLEEALYKVNNPGIFREKQEPKKKYSGDIKERSSRKKDSHASALTYSGIGKGYLKLIEDTADLHLVDDYEYRPGVNSLSLR